MGRRGKGGVRGRLRGWCSGEGGGGDLLFWLLAGSNSKVCLHGSAEVLDVSVLACFVLQLKCRCWIGLR